MVCTCCLGQGRVVVVVVADCVPCLKAAGRALLLQVSSPIITTPQDLMEFALEVLYTTER